MCPVRLFTKLLELRPAHITSDRLFLTPNPAWSKTCKKWYKNQPVGVNEISKWTQEGAKAIGLDTENKKITNHSKRATAVSQLLKAGVTEQQVIAITGHSTTKSIQPYVTINPEHHKNIIDNMRLAVSKSIPASATITTTELDNHTGTSTLQPKQAAVFQNCTFNIQNFNTSNFET